MKKLQKFPGRIILMIAGAMSIIEAPISFFLWIFNHIIPTANAYGTEQVEMLSQSTLPSNPTAPIISAQPKKPDIPPEYQMTGSTVAVYMRVDQPPKIIVTDAHKSAIANEP